MKLHTESYGNIRYLENVPAIEWQPTGFMNSEQFRSFLLLSTEEYRKRKPDEPQLKVINDGRLLKAISKADQKWLDDVINQVVLDVDLQYMAFILPNNFFGRTIANRYIETTLKRNDHNLTIEAFKKYDDGIDWLKKQRNR